MPKKTRHIFAITQGNGAATIVRNLVEKADPVSRKHENFRQFPGKIYESLCEKLREEKWKSAASFSQVNRKTLP